MTRINTNVSSLIAQKTLSRTNTDLQTSLTRLSTGLRINSGKDDPAGLIASENLRRDITSIEKAISNSERANQLIATADSALGQVSSLLNDIRGLVLEAANTGALSDEQIAANQLQVDSSLEALNRIAQTTTFQGRRLLDGSLDFITSAGANFSNVTDLNIDQANLGASGNVSVAISVTTAATQAQVDITGIATTASAANGTGSVAFSNVVAQATGSATLDGETFDLTALAGGNAENAEGNEAVNLVVNYSQGAAATSYTAATNTLSVDVTQAAGVATIANIRAAIDGGTDFSTANPSDDAALVSSANGTLSLSGGRDAGSATVNVTTADTTNNFNTSTVIFTSDATLTSNTATAALDSNNDIEVRYNGVVTYTAIATAIDNLAEFTAAVAAPVGDQNFQTGDTATPTAISGGAEGGITEDVVLELSGSDGAEVLNFEAGTGISDLASAINLISDATGVSATVNSTTLELTSVEYGSNAIVDVQVISEDTGGSFTASVGQGTRATGTDLAATLNGVLVNGNGNSLSLNTATLDLSATVAASFTGTINFNITGGGALFQIGPDVATNQQARIGITSLNTARLGGATGKLFSLQSGGTADLTTDATTAVNIVDEAINKVTSLRGRLGAFQKTTLETNIFSLNDTLAALTEAESSIRDADFAAESASLTRAQILVQSGTSVLAIANSNPQNVLALLR